MQIAFIGLGNMGAPMAANLVGAGHQVRVFDLVESAMATLEEQGASRASSALEAAEGAEVVVSMLPAGAHVKALYLGRDGAEGLLDQLSSRPLLLDASTISPDDARLVAGEAANRGLAYLDAPVSGGIGGAKAGTLTFIVGGDADAYEQARPVLEAMGKNLFHAGPSGSGQVAKICNNMLLGILMSGTAEALSLGVKNGMDPAVLSEIMKQSSGGNWALNVYNPWPGVMEGSAASRDYQGGFLTDLMAKDLGLAWELALESRASVPMGSQARNLFALHSAQGNGGLDFSSIQSLYRAGESSGQ
ncbi:MULTISPECIES: 3-hydroxyisobutyrate dehydrogenase [unclassified Halomonas]|uniref:3-hydroxyisobutyrate dehydrogenase n=1 Tax=unclassified Halomonas TaxID=2609666 RepID=UPI000E8C9F15|nr:MULTISPECIES: 3-hydroxyisobutyrate dehydrogenase [unclassified Halomonas]MBY5942938.1 3-hydroxyisobutyrate dehydrogenase [Halomonas sp. DP5N14-9]MBY6112754.1 3-hydroxyisobutyrate dehydrogenase [Halomonas sp. DP1Y21-3]MCO7215515.1 3-hydroxyisobutyrate dehydrogenase [Halomonas sp. OfavH-34-E]HAR09139.1 3-hydroxyisobutyrate dehydrogenase [Cobetia sp.]